LFTDTSKKEDDDDDGSERHVEFPPSTLSALKVQRKQVKKRDKQFLGGNQRERDRRTFARTEQKR
jgi:hypothetical protein